MPVLDGPGDGEEAVDGDGSVVEEGAQGGERRRRAPHLKLDLLQNGIQPVCFITDTQE